MDTSLQIKNKKRQFIGLAVLTVLLLTAAVTLGTMIAYEVPFRYDMTEQKLFTLSGDSLSCLEELNSPVRIGAVYPSGQENPYVSSLLNEYEKASEMVTVEYIDAEKNPSALAGYALGDVQAVFNGTLIIESGEQVQLVYSDDLFESGSSGNLFYGEREITGAIRYVSSEELPTVYFTQGHGELSVTNQLSDAIRLLQLDAYAVNTCVLLQTGIPEDADILILAAPQSDLTEGEVELLRQFLERGKSLLLLLDPVMNSNVKRLDVLNGLVNAYGIDISNNYVVEEDPSYYLSTSDMYLIPRYGAHEITKPIGEAERLVILPLARGLGGVDYDKSKVTRDILLLTSDRAWARADVSIPDENKTSRDVSGPIPLGMAASRSNEGSGNISSRIVVLGDATFACDGNVTVQANGDLLLNSVNWLLGGRERELITGKVINSDVMIVRGNEFVRLAVICCAVMPMLAFCGAFLLWRLRKNR